MTWLWHSGQSGQPIPESVTRTMTPIVTSRIVATTVATASFWKRVTGGGGPRGSGAGRVAGLAARPHSTHDARGRPGPGSASGGDSGYARTMLRSPVRTVALLGASVALLVAACAPSPTPSPSAAAGP